MSDKIGLFTGSFDPLTNGHLDLIQRASQLFDVLYVGIFVNPHKQGLFASEERKRLIEEAVAELPRVKVLLAQDELVVDVARKIGATYLVRGLRNGIDLEYEASFDFYNRELAPDIETIYLLAKPEYKFVSSGQVRELLHFRQDVSPYVPENISKELMKNEEK
ncbi:pantetheine-phosphate adenylyltransferase [Streptococcus acidominimus]|uniref:Phosphopantetheine adenylyltransferase n=1 Tax=Streptococcus acidominimus TaxID=1326 RepID=A0A1Q8ECX1_STRAI|nr:pantetheine-phosphate adenylyltransferase [Streptococcus acidominimus]MBF0847920.1 pantetheine-phosphate adenylyltransferase [Streptococcus danieliae]MBF0819240.1 pantetheine-phosphate adenylyltransferase [Streptococcus acidominimus]MBF0839476.1 pantetheine-phosphate adenylyltransferase [Streptococcus acidominimus]OLF49654.1 pantetheine-phosphate adenylyltransferase [Streptococcus acidominimus]TFU30166.1 pantetheine-phosphate adenylyltransferase [Streptococcus acidominimus]